jgi:hypothetical protein
MIALLVSAAFAMEVDVGVGAELVTNDPFMTPIGLRVATVVRPLPWLGVGASLAGHPLHPMNTYGQYLEAVQIVPDYSPILGSASVFGDVRFARGAIGRFDGALDLVVGAGGVYTVEDCAAMGMGDDAACLATQREAHLASVIGLSASVGSGRWALRVRGERWQYTERVFDTVKENKIPIWAGVDAVVRFGGPKR